MPGHIHTYAFGTEGHSRLTLAAELISGRTGLNCVVANVDFNEIQGRSWTTIVIQTPDGAQKQILNTATHKAIVEGTSIDINQAIENTVKLLKTQNHLDDYANKYELIRDMAKIIAKIPAMRSWELAYGVINHITFTKLDRPAKPNEGDEAIALIHQNGTMKYQSIHCDSMPAALYDMGRLIEAAIF